MITVHSSEEFREAVIEQLNFQSIQEKYCKIFKDPHLPENGYFLLYERPGFYDFGIADYTIPKCFSLSFNNPQRLVRFGTVYKGTTEFQIDNEPISSFKPSSFFVVEKDLKGKQHWTTGQHFHGAEITIYEDYFNQVIAPLLKTNFDFDQFEKNYTYPYLPHEVIHVLQKMQTLSNKNLLSPLMLESCILECISLIIQIVEESDDNAFTKQLNHGKVKIGENRYLHLSHSDIKAIQKAHDILTKNLQHPPTIEKLSELVLLNPQKLKAGFSHYYHMSIGEFTTTLRMTLAANLLCTTDKSIADIAQEVGYHYCGNFIKMFKQTYELTPLQYRNSHFK